MWKGRFREETDVRVQEFTQSLDLDWRLAPWDLRGSEAHARMLVRTGILTPEEGETIHQGLETLRRELEAGELAPRVELEDVHMNLEARLTELVGPVGAKLHTGRSRNDQVAVTLRLYLRDRLEGMVGALRGLLEQLLLQAERHEDVLIPGYTHLQQAQPIRLGHYWMAHFWSFLQDARRLDFARESLALCPLGAGALAGSTLPLDRHATSWELGFQGPTQNSMETVGQRDSLLDIHAFCLGVALHASRLAEDLILYATQEFGWLRLSDGFCTGSSMMPQKKNPDVLELIRGKTGGVLGRLVDLATSLKGLPMTYNRDLQEDKRGLFASLDGVEQVLEILPPLLDGIAIDEDRALAGFRDGLALATDVAEYLVVRGVPFRLAHEKVGKLVHWCLESRRDLPSLSLAEWQSLIPEVEEDLLPLLDLRVSVDRRKTFGGTGISELRRQRAAGRRSLQVWISR